MLEPKKVLLKDLLVTTKDGDWGKGDPEEGYVPFNVIRATDFGDTALGQSGKVPVRYLSERTVQRRTLEADDILIETAGGSPGRPTGRTMLVTDRVLSAFSLPITCASFARFLRVDKEIVDPRYLYWYLQSLYQSGEIEQYQVQHTGVARFQYTNFAATHHVPVVGMREQRAIAEVLGALDDKIAANSKLTSSSAHLAQTLFAEASTGDRRAEAVLADSCELLSRGITPKYSDDDETMVVLNQKCVRGQRVNLEPSRRTLLAKVRPDKVLLHDDVLVNSTGQGTLGRVARWTHDSRVTVDSHITIVRFNPELVDPVCGGFAVLRNEADITAMAEGSTGQTELSRVELGKLRLTFPPREQQQSLGRQLAIMTAMENAYWLENDSLASTRDTLLPQLMSGKLRVKDVEALVDSVV